MGTLEKADGFLIRSTFHSRNSSAAIDLKPSSGRIAIPLNCILNKHPPVRISDSMYHCSVWASGRAARRSACSRASHSYSHQSASSAAHPQRMSRRLSVRSTKNTSTAENNHQRVHRASFVPCDFVVVILPALLFN